MFTHDPYQNFSTVGAYLTGATPYGLPYNPGIQQLQAALLAQAIQQQIQQQQIQQQLQQQLQNPFLAMALQNPFASNVAQNPLLNPTLQQTHSQHPQIGQIGGLQPQSWVGQGGLGVGQPFGAQPFGTQPFGGQQFGGLHPLVAQQLAARLGQTPGINPWGGY